jgi:hypothetical protein
MARRRTWVAAVALVAAIAGVVAVVLPVPAGAFSGNCSPYHCYSIDWDTRGYAFAGTLVEQHNSYMTPGNGGGDINSEQWLVSAGGAWAEAGLKNGWDPNYGRYAYGWFWADSTDGGRTQWLYPQFSPDGTDHTIQISWGPCCYTFNVYIDGVHRATTRNVRFQYGQPQWGAELMGTPTNAHADTFNQYLSVVNSSQHVVGGSVVNPGSVHAGMNGVSWASNEWSWNAP